MIRDFDVATFGREGSGIHTVHAGAVIIGRPYDSWYELESVTDDRVELTIVLAGGLSLTVPHAATVRDLGESLLVTDFESAMLSGGGFGTRRYRPGVIELMAVSFGVQPVGQHGPR